MKEESWSKYHGGMIMKEEASGSIRGYLGSIWEASGGIEEEASGSILGALWNRRSIYLH